MFFVQAAAVTDPQVCALLPFLSGAVHYQAWPTHLYGCSRQGAGGRLPDAVAAGARMCRELKGVRARVQGCGV